MNDSIWAELAKLDEGLCERTGFEVESIEHKALLAMGLAGEVGELVLEIQKASAALCNNIKKEWRDGEVQAITDLIMLEMADCYIYLDRLAARYGVTLEDAVVAKIAVVKMRNAVQGYEKKRKGA